MAASSYDEALRRLIAHEGGYSNHASDPGGPTKFGITIHDYRKYVNPRAGAAEVKAMRLAEAQAIYRAKYWDAMRGDELSVGVDYCVFDYAVNSGTGRTPKVLQRVLGCPVSGRMDDATVRLAAAADAKRLITAICDERLRFLQGLKTWPVFGAGWGRRVAEVRAVALAMAGKQATDNERHKKDASTAEQRVRGPSSEIHPSASGKGVVPVNKAAQRGTTGAVVGAGGAAASQASDPIIVAGVVIVVLAVAAAAWLFWRWRQKRQQEAAA
jgi:lysozyme family protein